MSLSTVNIAWRNLGRNRKRTLLAVSAIALGQLTLVFVNGFMAGMFNDMLDTVTGPLVGHVQIHQRDWREERAVDLYIDNLSVVVGEMESLPEVTSISPRIYSPALSASGELMGQPADAEPAMVVGVDIAKESQRGGILEGLAPEALSGSGNVFLGKVLATRLGVTSGQQLAVIAQDVDGFPVSDLFRIRGILDSKVDIVQRLGIVMPLQDSGEFLAMPDQAHEIVVQGEDFRKAEALAAATAALPSLTDSEILPWREAVPQLVRLLDMKGWADFFFLAIVFVAAAAGIANTSMMSTYERKSEFGMLLAVGTRPGRIVRMVLIESVIIGLLGVAIGSVLGSALVIVTSHTGINYAALGGSEGADIGFQGFNFSYILYPAFEFRHIVSGLCAVILTSVLASLWPAAAAARMEPVEAMRA
jgi:ABC-type lipoprotein release transport system permease subunit